MMGKNEKEKQKQLNCEEINKDSKALLRADGSWRRAPNQTITRHSCPEIALEIIKNRTDSCFQIAEFSHHCSTNSEIQKAFETLKRRMKRCEMTRNQPVGTFWISFHIDESRKQISSRALFLISRERKMSSIFYFFRSASEGKNSENRKERERICFHFSILFWSLDTKELRIYNGTEGKKRRRRRTGSAASGHWEANLGN